MDKNAWGDWNAKLQRKVTYNKMIYRMEQIAYYFGSMLQSIEFYFYG